MLLTAVPLREGAAQSLGDVARTEAERRKAAPAGKVYTNENLPVVPPAPVAAAAAGDAAQAKTGDRVSGSKPDPDARAGTEKGASGKKDEAKDEKKDEAYWRDRLKSLRDAKARAESFAEALQSRINALSTDFVNRDDPAQRNVIAADRQKALDELARVRKEIQEHTRALDDLQTEARREGVPPGWVR